MSAKDNNAIIVKQVMLSIEKTPIVRSKAILKEALDIMDEFKLGVVTVVDDDNILIGVLTDGDIRRTLLRVQKPMASFLIDDISKHCVLNPVYINSSQKLTTAVSLMGDKQIWDLPVVSEKKELIGLLHLHQAIKVLINKGT
jgi:DeoR family transcriptional regulator, catabolite repression regulator